jgi:hypothetical protein
MEELGRQTTVEEHVIDRHKIVIMRRSVVRMLEQSCGFGWPVRRATAGRIRWTCVKNRATC